MRATRRYERYDVEVPVRGIWGGRVHDCVTGDVSYGGLFVRTAEAPPLRQLIRLDMLQATLGGRREPLRLHAMVTHVRPPGGERAPGMGLQLFGLGREERAAWVSYIDQVSGRSRARALAAQPPLVLDGGPSAQQAPSSPLEIRLPDVARLEELYSRMVTGRPIWLDGCPPRAAGEGILLALVHPLAPQVFSLAVRIRAWVGTGRASLVLVDSTGEVAASLWRFVSTNEHTVWQGASASVMPFHDADIEGHRVDRMFDNLLAH